MTLDKAIQLIDEIASSYYPCDKKDALEMAIKALEPCEDAISREQVINAVADLFEMNEYPHPYPQGKPIRLKDIKEKLKQLPPVTPKPKTGHWIPVSERLPEESDYVSCLPFYDGVVIWLTDKGIMGFGWYYNSTNNWADTNDCWSDKYGEVIAWMPLPLPWKGE